MSIPKHTSGPWEARCESFKGWAVCKSKQLDRPLAVVYSRDEDYGIDGGKYYDKECKANAHLIAAAPDLKAACVEALGVIDDPGIMDVDEWKAWKKRTSRQLYDAIAKTNPTS